MIKQINLINYEFLFDNIEKLWINVLLKDIKNKCIFVNF